MSTTQPEMFQYISQKVGVNTPGPGSLSTRTTSPFQPLPAAYASAELKTSSLIASRQTFVSPLKPEGESVPSPIAAAKPVKRFFAPPLVAA